METEGDTHTLNESLRASDLNRVLKHFFDKWDDLDQRSPMKLLMEE